MDYTAWKASAEDLRALDAYLALLSTAAPRRSASKPATLVFWINAYNAVTIKGILREYPTTSIRNHTARVFGYNIWQDLQLLVGGSAFSLDAMEHQVLRKVDEPRIHFAIVCASRSCPKLLNRAYVADRLEQQLRTNTRDFFADPDNFRYDAQRGRFWLSSIMDWFAEDFGRTEGAQLRYLSAYLPDAKARQTAAAGRGSISYLPYDWGLNDQATAKK